MQTNDVLISDEIPQEYAHKSVMRSAYMLLLVALVLTPVVRSTLFLRQRSPYAYAAVDLYNVVQIIATIGMAIVLCGRRAAPSNRLMVSGPTRLLLLYAIFCGVSSLWSSSPIYSVFRALEIGLLLLFMGHLLHTMNNPRLVLLWLCRLAAFSALVGYLPGLLRGQILQHTNSYSPVGAFGAVLALACVRRGIFRLTNIKYSLITCIVTVALGTSSASNVSLLVGILMIMASSKYRAISVGRLLLVAIVTFICLTSAFDVVKPYVFPGKTDEQIWTMRGRTGLFAAYIDTIREHPIAGNGFAVGERVALGPGVNWTHNSLVSVAVNTGIIGLLLFAWGFCIIGYTLYRAHVGGSAYAYPVMIAIMVGFLNSMSYPLIGSVWTPSTTSFFGMVTFVSVYLSSSHRQNSLVEPWEPDEYVLPTGRIMLWQ